MQQTRLDSDVAIAFLRRYPTGHAAARLTQARFAAFLRRISYCGRTPASELYARVHDAPVGCQNSVTGLRWVFMLLLGIR